MKNIKFISLFLVVLFTASCGDDFLEPLPTSVISAPDYYQNEDQLEAGLINIYDGLQGTNDEDRNSNHATQMEFYVTEMRSDNTRTKSGQGEAAQFDTFQVQSTNGLVADYYRSFYNVIFRANIVLENIGVATEENRLKFEGEAKFLRAHSYFNLVRLYGDIPLVSSVIGISDTNISFTRTPKSEVYELIISDLNTAIEGLDNTYVNRASKAAAQALLAKVYLTLGTNYTAAQTLCEEVMASGYTLEDNFYDVFYNEGNSEVIFAIGYISNNTENSQNFSAEWTPTAGRTSGVNYLTQDIKDVLDTFGGNRTAVSYIQDTQLNNAFRVAKYLPNGEEGPNYTPNPRLSGNDWIVLRYADVLLMHVEAIMAGGQETSSSAAINSFQLVRDRAGLNDPVTTITKADLLLERRVELAFENQRLFDLIRFGEAQNTLSEFALQNEGSFSSSDLLLPIPQIEIGLSNGLLQQNPGY